MKSRFDRRSFLSRLGVSTGIGAMAIITGACSENAGTDPDAVPANTGVSEPAVESEAASADSETSTDTPASGEQGDGAADAENVVETN